MAFFTELQQITLKFMETQKTLNSRNNLEKEESWKYHNLWFQTIIQIYSNQNCVVLAQKTDTEINETEERAQK